MSKRAELSVLGQPGERTLFPAGVVTLDQVEHLRGEHEETTVDEPAVTARLLDELVDLLSRHAHRAKTAGRSDDRHRCLSTPCSMEFELRPEVDVGDAVAIGHEEVLIGIEVLGDPFEPSTGHSPLAEPWKSSWLFPRSTVTVEL